MGDVKLAESKRWKCSNAKAEKRCDEMHLSYRNTHCSVDADQACAFAWYSIEEQLHFALTSAISFLDVSTRE